MRPTSIARRANIKHKADHPISSWPDNIDCQHKKVGT